MAKSSAVLFLSYTPPSGADYTMRGFGPKIVARKLTHWLNGSWRGRGPCPCVEARLPGEWLGYASGDPQTWPSFVHDFLIRPPTELLRINWMKQLQ